jgi:threonine synthase
LRAWYRLLCGLPDALVAPTKFAARYAARAGMPCVIFTLQSVPATMKTLIQAYGAVVVAANTIEERNALMLEALDRFGWYPVSNASTPPVGSSPFGVDGYKTIAYELWDQLEGEVPDWVIVPTAYGDCSAGIHRGFIDLRTWGLAEKVPRIVGAEVFGALEEALANGIPKRDPKPSWPTRAFSIGGGYATYQAIRSIKDSNGHARSATEGDLMTTQLELGAREGLFAEAASVAGLCAARTLRCEGALKPDDLVVSVLTSSGLKDPVAVAASLPPVPVVAHLDEVIEAMVSQGMEPPA